MTTPRLSPYTDEQIAQRAEASRTNDPDHCFQWSRTMAGLPAVGDYDGDGSADAEDGYKAAIAGGQLHTDRRPPRGAIVFYSGGSRDNGHAAVSLSAGMERSTDAGGRGVPATVPLDWPEREWGLTYVGWTLGYAGWVIPATPETKTKQRREEVQAALKALRHVRDTAKTERGRKAAQAVITRVKADFPGVAA